MSKKSLGKKEAFYIALEKALHNYLKAKLHIETSDLSKENIQEYAENHRAEILKSVGGGASKWLKSTGKFVVNTM